MARHSRGAVRERVWRAPQLWDGVRACKAEGRLHLNNTGRPLPRPSYVTTSEGYGPYGGLVADSAGNLYGTTEYSGYGYYGTVFEIPKTSEGYPSTPTTLFDFVSYNGEYPTGNLIINDGNLISTTYEGGLGGVGTIFWIDSLVPACDEDTDCITFPTNGADGANPTSGVIANAAEDLFGTTRYGGTSGYGTVFEVVNEGEGHYKLVTPLVSFNKSDGAYPFGGLILDAAGNLYGTTSSGGTSGGYGTVFEIKKTSTGYANTPTTLFNFDYKHGATPYGGLILDAAGDLYGTTVNGGKYSYGTVFKLTP
jgi:uncharacterized repeat protein (TIGR03803 family)